MNDNIDEYVAYKDYIKASKEFQQKEDEKEYIASFYTLEDLINETCSYEIELSRFQLKYLHEYTQHTGNSNYIRLNNAFIDLNKFAVIEFDEIDEDAK